MDKKKTPIGKIIQWAMSVVGFIAVMWFMFEASIAWGEFKAQQQEVSFPDSQTKHKVIDHTNEVPNAVENYKAQQEIIKKSERLDSVYTFALEVFESNTKNNDDAIRSRAKRDSINQLMLLNTLQQQQIQIEQSKKIDEILEMLDTIQ